MARPRVRPVDGELSIVVVRSAIQDLPLEKIWLGREDSKKNSPGQKTLAQNPLLSIFNDLESPGR